MTYCKFAAPLRLPMTLALAGLMAVTALSTRTIAQEKLQSGSLTPAGAAVTKPVVVATLASLNKMMADVNYISAMVGQPQAGGMFAMLAGSMAQGIDMDKPIGILVSLVDGVPEPIAMLPTADVKSVLQRIEAQTGGAEELDDGTLVIAMGVNTVYIKQVGSWAALSPKRESLKLAPADPTAYFKGLGNDYFLAARVQMQQVPAETRQTIVEQLRQGFEQAMNNQDGDAAAKQAAEAQLEAIERLIRETDEFMFGLNIDQSAGNIIQDFSLTAIPGSQLAAGYGGQQPAASKFASVIRDNAAMYYHGAVTISPDSVQQVEQQSAQSMAVISNAFKQAKGMSAKDKEAIEVLLRDSIKLAVESVKEGRADVGALMLADESQGRFVAGMMVADGAEAAQIVKDFAAKIADSPDAPEFNFDTGTYNGVTLHRVEKDIPAEMDEVRKMFGNKLVVHVGTAAKAVYLAVGDDSMLLMQELIDAPMESSVPANRPSGQMKLKLLPILEYAQSIESNATVSAIIDTLSSARDIGIVTIVANSIPNGSKGRVTLSEGLLKAVGAAVQANQRQAGGF